MITNFEIFEKKKKNKKRDFIMCISKDERRTWVTIGKQYELSRSIVYVAGLGNVGKTKFKGDDSKLYEVRKAAGHYMKGGNPCPPNVSYYCYPYDDVLFSSETPKAYQKRLNIARFDL